MKYFFIFFTILTLFAAVTKPTCWTCDVQTSPDTWRHFDTCVVNDGAQQFPYPPYQCQPLVIIED